METVDLSTDGGLRSACEAAERENPRGEWRAEIEDYLREIADPLQTSERFASEKFQRLLWIDNPIAKARLALINDEEKLEDTISKEEFRQRFLELYDEISGRWSNQPSELSVEKLADLAQKVRDLLEENCGFKPHFALYRALAGLFPTEFTTIASTAKLRDLAKRMDIDFRGGTNNPEKIAKRHRLVLDRLEEAIGAIDSNNLSEVAQRMTLPWGLVELVESDEEMQPSDEARPEEANDEEKEKNSIYISVPVFNEINEQLEKAGYFPPEPVPTASPRTVGQPGVTLPFSPAFRGPGKHCWPGNMPRR